MRLKLEYDKLLSFFAFNFNLRRCGEDSVEVNAAAAEAEEVHFQAGTALMDSARHVMTRISNPRSLS